MPDPIYSIYASEYLCDIAGLPQKLKEAQERPVSYYQFRNKYSNGQLQEMKDKQIQKALDEIESAIELKNDILSKDKYKERYAQLKKYFMDKIAELGLREGAIRFNDAELCIDIDYSPKEFEALFPDFLIRDGIYSQIFNLQFGFFTKESPKTYFDNVCMSTEYATNLNNELKAIIDTDMNEVDTPTPELSQSPTEHELIDACLGAGNGMVIGESHEDSSPKEFLINNMEYMKSKGITTIYLEHLLHERHQTMLDDYFSSNDAPMPKELELYLKHLDKERKLEGNGTFYNLVLNAKKYGLRVVAIDNQATYGSNPMNSFTDIYNDSATKNRYTSMNKQMKIRLDEYNDGGKYIVFIGSAHVYKNGDVPGVTNYLGCAGIVVRDNDKNDLSDSHVQRNYQHPQGVTFDILYTRKSQPHPDSKSKLIV